MDQGSNVEVEDLRLKIKRAAKAEQTEALAANLVQAQDVEAAQNVLLSYEGGKPRQDGGGEPAGGPDQFEGVVQDDQDSRDD